MFGWFRKRNTRIRGGMNRPYRTGPGGIGRFPRAYTLGWYVMPFQGNKDFYFIFVHPQFVNDVRPLSAYANLGTIAPNWWRLAAQFVSKALRRSETIEGT